jgi:tRNA (guanine37-N1)-methyltransferase
MRVDVLTLFPELVGEVIRHGMPRRAMENGALTLTTRQIRDYSVDRNRRVDDRPYGGGPGMVMQAEPLTRALESARAELPAAKAVLLSPQGERLTQPWLQRLAREDALIFVCGRYEGIDERAAARVDLELSLGDYVLSGGELPAMVVIDGIARLLPGVLGDEQSAEQDSFSAGLFDHPHYSRPEKWRDEAVPEVLLCGDHAKVARWRLKQALGRTWLRRPELLEGLELNEEQTRLLREFIAEAPEAKGRERQS